MRFAAAFLMATSLFASAAFAQQPVPLPNAEKVQCLPSTNLDELIKALDDAVSGPGNKDRSCMRSLLMPDARMIVVTKKQDGNIAPHILTLSEWIDAVAKRGSNPFYERQIKVASEQFGNIAHLWSTYEIREKPNAKPEMRGINSIQALHDGTHWRVVEILWQVESPTNPIPEKYLP